MGSRKTSLGIAILPIGLWEVFSEVRNLDTPATLHCALWLLSNSQAPCPSPCRSGVSEGTLSGKGPGMSALACALPSAGIWGLNCRPE